jgi:histidyl-tRNA synthetase
MVNQKINSLPKPVKWFSVPRLFRAERPQKGRLREFFQWNIDIIGVDDVLADAEVIFTTIDYLRQIGLTEKDIKVKISSRELLAGFLKSLGIPEQKLGDLYVLLDKSAKLPADVFEELLIEQVQEKKITDKILEFMVEQSSEQMANMTSPNESTNSAMEHLIKVFNYLESMGIGDFCVFDPGIVRGLAYYTGIVFEVHDAVGQLRAICGGGRYDNLLKDFGGPSIPATGMGMGDCVLEILLREKGILEKQLQPNTMDFFVAYVDEAYKDEAVKITMELRSKGLKANFSYKAAKLNKQLKQASEQNSQNCIIIGDEFKNKKLAIKDMATGHQEEKELDKFLAELG